MIITCNECSTSFNLDDSLVKANGSRVRCSVCKNIFTAYPLPRKPEQTNETPPDGIPESAPAPDDISGFEMEDIDFSLKDSDLEIENQDLALKDLEFTSQDLEQKDNDFSFEENDFDLNAGNGEKIPDEKEFEFEAEDISIDSDEHKDDDFDGIKFEPMKDEPEELTLSMEESETDLHIEDEADLLADNFNDTDSHEQKEALLEEKGTGVVEKEEFELEFDMDGDTDTPDADKFPLEIVQEPEDQEEMLTLEDAEPDKELDEIALEDDFSDYDEVLAQETEPHETSGDIEDAEENFEKDMREKETIEERSLIEKVTPLMDLPERSLRKEKKPLISLPLLMLLLIFFLTAGAYIASILTGYKIPPLSDVNIPFLGQYLKKAAPAATDPKPFPNENSVTGRFVSNTGSGTLFVITGRVDNPSGIALSHIEVQGTLSTKEIPVAKTKNAFCGNIITEEMLKSGNIAEMMKLLEVREGAHNSNVNIKPGAGIPFMIVFSDLPEKLQNFNVKVVGFDKTAGN